MDDQELLRRYSEKDSEDAFRQLVERHAALVYSVAMRQLGRPHQAEEVTHAVFVALARKATTLKVGTILAGWLFRATRFAAAKLQRDEERRQRREKEAAIVTVQCNAEPDQVWEQILPLLDAELESLGEKDRSAVLLRFFEDRSFKEVGEALGASEDAAKMRVSRVLEKLRQRFLKRGVALSATAMADAIGSQARAATATAPPRLAAAVTKACATKGASCALVDAIARRLAWSKWMPVVVGASVVLITGSIALLLLRGRNPAPITPAATPAWPVQR